MKYRLVVCLSLVVTLFNSFSLMAKDLMLMDIEVSGFDDDPSYGGYYLDKLKVDKAWTITRGDKDIRVGHLSSGANYKLEVLREKIERNVGEMGDGKETNGIDDDQNGYTDDLYGINTHEGSNDPMDYHGVGTHTAGLVVSSDVLLPFRVSGIAPESRLILANPLSDNATGTTANVVLATEYLISRGARIISVGIGSPKISKFWCDLIAKASNILFVTPAGNGMSDLDVTRDMYPALCPSDNILVVATSDQHDQLASYSNYGKRSVHFVAPGDKIVGYNHIGKIQRISGSATAVAVAAGVAALTLSANPQLSTAQLKTILLNSVDILPGLQNKISTEGRINAYNAVRLARILPGAE